METNKTAITDRRVDHNSVGGAGQEWNARSLRPVAHWVTMPTTGGRTRLTMVWEVPDPLPPLGGA